MTHEISIVIIGFGKVGQALVRMILQKQKELETIYNITVKYTGIATGRHGAVIAPDGIDPCKLLELAERGQKLNSLSVSPVPASTLELIASCPADVLFELSPVNHTDGQPALDHLRCALGHGIHAITANKGPVAHAYSELRDLAASKGCRFLFESTVMDGAPVFSLFRETLPVVNLRGFSGILNSTTNLILERMEQGESFDQAVAYAQSVGIAETDPSDDIDGWDAAVKVSIIAHVLMGIPLKPQQVARQGIRSISPAMIKEAQHCGERWKLVCNAQRSGDTLQAQVAPERISPQSPLFNVNGTSSYMQFETDVLPGLGILENNPSLDTTAYGLLADFLKAVG